MKGTESLRTFEYDNRYHVCALDVEELIHFTEAGLASSHGEEICRTIPADVVEGRKNGRDLWDNYADDCGVDCNEQCPEVQGCNDKTKLPRR